MADYLVTDTELTDVADAIREKGGTSAALEWPDGFVDAIDAISGGGGAVAHSIQLRKNTQTGGILQTNDNIGQWDTSTLTWTGWMTPTAACVGDRVYVKNSGLYSIVHASCNVTLTYTGTTYGNLGVYYFDMPDYDVIIVAVN